MTKLITDLKVGESLVVQTLDGEAFEIKLDKKSGQVARLILTSSSEAKISKQKQ